MSGATLNRRANRASLLTLAAALAALAMVALAPGARAERADRDRPVNIESDRMSADDAKRTAVFEGRVVLTQGTLSIRAERIEVRQDGEGFQFGLATGSPATFRQKREGLNEYVEGEAERVEYDGKADHVQLFNRARIKRDGGDDVSGNYISYNSRTELFSVRSSRDAPAGSPGSPGSRVHAVIMPKTKDAGAAKPAAAAEPKSAPAIATPR